MTDKEKFVNLFNDCNIEFEQKGNYIIISDSNVDDWDCDHYVRIKIEFNEHDKFERFLLEKYK